MHRKKVHLVGGKLAHKWLVHAVAHPIDYSKSSELAVQAQAHLAYAPDMMTAGMSIKNIEQECAHESDGGTREEEMKRTRFSILNDPTHDDILLRARVVASGAD